MKFGVWPPDKCIKFSGDVRLLHLWHNNLSSYFISTKLHFQIRIHLTFGIFWSQSKIIHCDQREIHQAQGWSWKDWENIYRVENVTEWQCYWLVCRDEIDLLDLLQHRSMQWIRIAEQSPHLENNLKCHLGRRNSSWEGQKL